MPVPFRVVLDTNVLLAGRISRHPTSPSAEILDRWQRGEFAVLYSLDTLAEYAEKLLARSIPPADVEAFIRFFVHHAEAVSISSFHFRHYPIDPDDVMFLLCAANGQATHLLSYDQHLLALGPYYAAEFAICEPVEFLAACRTRNPQFP